MLARARRMKKRILAGVIVALVALALPRLGYEFHRLLIVPDHKGAVDLKHRYNEVHRWVSGESVYATSHSAVYPPASYLMLWPALGWLPLDQARWLWACTLVLAMGSLLMLLIQESLVTTSSERLAIALFVLANYATAVTIGNGQLVLHLLPALLIGILWLHREPPSWPRDVVVAALLVWSLVKPSLSVPFFWVALCGMGALRVMLLVAAGYVVLTCGALWFQPAAPVALVHELRVNMAGLAFRGGYGNVNTWLLSAGLAEWTGAVSLLMLLALGAWTYRHRGHDLWILMGVAALTARLWSYHRLYDDALILVAMVALLRLVGSAVPGSANRHVAAGLLAASAVGLLVPGTLLQLPYPSGEPFRAAQSLLWVAMLGFLVWPPEGDSGASGDAT